MSGRVFVIGLDGATFTVLDPLMERGVMPFLKSFTAAGVRAGLRTIVPPLTPPAWTSLMTGRSPGHHGVFDFFRMESAEDLHIRFANSHDIQVETIWAIATRHGKRVTALNFPLMFPAPQVNGFVVPGWVPWKQMRLACAPADLFERLKALPGFNPRELAMDIKLEEKATEGCEHTEYAPWIEFHIRREKNWRQILEFLDSTEPSDLTAVLFDGVDKLQHLVWRFIVARREDLREEWEQKIHDLCMQYFRELDELIEAICARAGEDATVLIASDHGFGATDSVFHVNAWLEKNGYLAWSEAGLAQDRSATLGVGQVARHTYLLDWSKTRAFATTPTSNGIFIVRSKDGEGPGVPDSEYESFRARLMEDLKTLIDPVSGEPVVSRIWTREEAFSGPAGSVAPDLTLALRDGGLVSILPAEEMVTPRKEIAGTHRPVGVFLGKGPGIQKGADLGEMSILDIAPAVLYGLGLPLSADLEGKSPAKLYSQEHLASHPVQIGASTVAVSREGNGIPLTTAEDEAVVMERLRELGYIE